MNSDPLNFPPPYNPPNPFREVWDAIRAQQELSEQMTRLASHTQTMVIAHQAVLYALIASHPRAQALMDAYLDQMDALADLLPESDVPQYRAAAQRFQQAILAAANRQDNPPSGP